MVKSLIIYHLAKLGVITFGNTMAAKPTIYKFKVALSNCDTNQYENLSITVALHPSETLERMMVRVLAFCFHAQERLEFSNGLYEPEEADLWVQSLDGLIDLWIDIGEPSAERIKKIGRKSKHVWIYTFNTKSDAWWEKNQAGITKYKVNVRQFSFSQIQSLTALVDRTLDASLSISDGSAFFSADTGSCDITWSDLTA